MNAKPLGVFTGSKEIEGFWRPFIEFRAGNLVYQNVKLGGDWFLERDDFEVQEKFSS